MLKVLKKHWASVLLLAVLYWMFVASAYMHGSSSLLGFLPLVGASAPWLLSFIGIFRLQSNPESSSASIEVRPMAPGLRGAA